MNTYKKYCPNVFIAQCEEEYQKDDIITLTTRRGGENEHIVHNFLGERNGFYFYSITRADGFNSQERAKRKAERLDGWAQSADAKSAEAWEASHEGRDFLALAEPIKVGHHSEKRHRALIQRNHNRIEKAIEFSDKAELHRQKAEYWASRADEINLSMPESIEYFEFELEEARKKHAGLKDGTIQRSHSYSLTYAKKAVNDLKKKYKMAVTLWG